MAEIGKDLEKAAYWLRRGEVIGIPTETVYGLAGNALAGTALARIFEVKERPQFNPLILHTDDPAKLPQFVTHFPPLARKLANAYWPGPLTLLLPKRPEVPELLTAGNERVAIRIPRHFLTLKLLAQLDFPLAAPSANPFGYISPTQAVHVDHHLGNKIPYILDGGPSQVGVESTILGMERDGSFKVYRLGGLDMEEIEAITGPILRAKDSEKPQSSGSLKSHYAPRTHLILGEILSLWARHGGDRVAVLNFSKAKSELPLEQQFFLSEKGDSREAASRLFGLLRKLDGGKYDKILAERLPEKGLGPAINDRLSRAQAANK